MSHEREAFLEAEQSAQEILTVLTDLRRETLSYRTSTKELESVRQHLIGLIDSFQAVATDVDEVIRLLKGVGGIGKLRKLTAAGVALALMTLAGIAVLVFR
jgi:hypothetical protein